MRATTRGEKRMRVLNKVTKSTTFTLNEDDVVGVDAGLEGARCTRRKESEHKIETHCIYEYIYVCIKKKNVRENKSI